jgi:hypothetical protein
LYFLKGELDVASKTVNYELERMQTEAIAAYFNVVSLCLERMKKSPVRIVFL